MKRQRSVLSVVFKLNSVRIVIALVVSIPMEKEQCVQRKEHAMAVLIVVIVKKLLSSLELKSTFGS